MLRGHPGGHHASVSLTRQTASDPASLGSVRLRTSDLSDTVVNWQGATLAKWTWLASPAPLHRWRLTLAQVCDFDGPDPIAKL